MDQQILFSNDSASSPVIPDVVPESTTAYRFSEFRARTRISPDDLERVKGKILEPSAYDVLLTGPTRLALPNGQPLALYLPGAIPQTIRDSTITTLREVGRMQTDNRGLASGYERKVRRENSTRSRTPVVNSAVAGAMDPGGAYRYCRLTAFSGKETEKWVGLFPLFRIINDYFKRYVPERYAAQENFAASTQPDWLIAGTVFTTVTVNRSYPTGVHTDAGDLDEGFSTLAVLRSGAYTGGVFTFPEYRVGVDMKDGDLLLMDAHQWHGNTYMECSVCNEGMGSPEFFPSHDECGSERISVVSYYRTKMKDCGTREEEFQKARDWAEKRIGIGEAAADELLRAKTLQEMAEEAVG